MYDPLERLTQLLVTEDGEPLVDVLQAMRHALEKQNKVLFKLVSVLETRLPQ